MNEIWKTIKGYENYEISNHGRVRSKQWERKHYCGGTCIIPEKIMKPTICERGYERIGLVRNGKQRSVFIHKLVAKAFIPNPLQKPFINHIDCNGLNNFVDNLEWCTQSENVQYAYNIGRCEHALDKKRKPVVAIKIKSDEILQFKSMNDAGRHFGVGHQAISRCCLGKVKSAYGYKWRFANEKRKDKSL